MAGTDLISFENRTTRHVAFWLSWILGFTFIKSLGAGLEEYIAWFVYYIITLPVFMAHTYLVVYWLIPRFLHGWKIMVFMLLFLVASGVFSLIDILVSSDVLATWFPEVFREEQDVYSPGNVVVNGLGNLYIILVFIAARLIRSWYLAAEEKRKISENNLKDLVAAHNRYVQPGFLVFAMEKLEDTAGAGNSQLSPGIAVLSELLNGLIILKDQKEARFDEELKLIRLLLDFHGRSDGSGAVKLFVSGRESAFKHLPVLLAFSVTELVMRFCNGMAIGNLTVEPGTGERKLILATDIPIERDAGRRKQVVQQVTEGLNELFPSAYVVEMDEMDGAWRFQVFETR